MTRIVTFSEEINKYAVGKCSYLIGVLMDVYYPGKERREGKGAEKTSTTRAIEFALSQIRKCYGCYFAVKLLYFFPLI